jgi:perosamine synthetase
LSQAVREIPLSRPWLDEREEELVLEVLRSGRLSLGPWIERFEQGVAERVGAPYAAALSSGTAGLHLLCRIAGLGPGDEVITSPLSFVSSANCFTVEGATPVFADVDPVTLNLDPAAVEAAITERTRAIVAVDMFGLPCDLDPLRELADRHGLALIEDACESLGAEYKGQPLGSHGPSAVFAFYPNKQITTGEGGAITVQTEAEWEELKSLSNQGRSDSGEWLTHSRLGYNYRLDDVSAALGVAQVEKLDRVLELRAQVAARYADLLEAVDGVQSPLPEDGIDRNGVMARLAEQGIASKPYLPSIHLQPYWRERFDTKEGMFPVSEATSRRSLALPFHTRLPEADQERVVRALASSLR